MGSSRRARAALVAFAVAASSCAPALIKLPSGAGASLSSAEAASALADATSECRAIRTLTAEVAVSGSTSGSRVRARLLVGVESPGRARIEAAAPFGAPFFIFVATGRDATLLLPRDNRVLQHGTPEAVLDAVAGIPLSAANLDEALTGCVAESPVASGASFGDSWRKVALEDGTTVFLQRPAPAARWLVNVVSTAAWRIDYPDRRAGIPAALALASVDAGGKLGDRFNLRLALSQVETNRQLGCRGVSRRRSA